MIEQEGLLEHMINDLTTTDTHGRLTPDDLPRLFDALHGQGYTIVGPTVVEGTIVFRELTSPNALPRGWQETQGPGQYTLTATNTTINTPAPTPPGTNKPNEPDKMDLGPFFAHRNGPDSARAWFLPQKQRLWSAKRSAEKPSDYEIFFPPEKAKRQKQKLAFIGLRACDLKAIAIQDRVFLQDKFQQPEYAAGRENTLIIAVNCTSHAQTCFCTSMHAGPAVTEGFDLALTEIHTPGQAHYFVTQTGSAAGQALLASLGRAKASPHEIKTAKTEISANAQSMPKQDFSGVPAAMKHQPEHPAWEAIAAQCLSCANCTLVCPTCFCTTVEDTTDLSGDTAERWLQWDSCFNEGHSYIHGGKVHGSIASRYRQWATHKLSSWHEQFGESGCVGCGRCIAWCPVGIDIRETAAQFTHAGEATGTVTQPSPTKQG